MIKNKKIEIESNLICAMTEDAMVGGLWTIGAGVK